MSRIKIDPPLVARRGKELKVLGVARISGRGHQTEKSNEDQEALYNEWLRDRSDIPFSLTVIAGTGSGEYLDRQEVERVQQELDSGQYDVLICEDLGRCLRRVHAYLLCEAAEDVGTRLFALNDQIDTARDDWRLHAFFATMRHELYNADTAKRVRRTQRNRFANGGMVRTPVLGYLKPADCKSDADLRKNPDLEWVVLGIFDRLESGWSYARVADWLKELRVPVGAGCRRKNWDGPMVRRFVFNPVLKGLRIWNDKKALRINKSGRRKAIKAPVEERIERYAPHLAFVETGRYDRLIATLIKLGDKYSVPKRRGNDPRKGRSRKKTRFPGQQVYCEHCNELFVFGGHGKTDHLMCNGARGQHFPLS